MKLFLELLVGDPALPRVIPVQFAIKHFRDELEEPFLRERLAHLYITRQKIVAGPNDPAYPWRMANQLGTSLEQYRSLGYGDDIEREREHFWKGEISTEGTYGRPYLKVRWKLYSSPEEVYYREFNLPDLPPRVLTDEQRKSVLAMCVVELTKGLQEGQIKDIFTAVREIND